MPLLVARILADDAKYIFALYDAAALAKAFDGCSYFHFGSLVLKRLVSLDKKSRWERVSPVRFRRFAYFCRKVIRPFVRLQGLISSRTLPHGNIRMRCNRIFSKDIPRSLKRFVWIEKQHCPWPRNRKNSHTSTSTPSLLAKSGFRDRLS